jgi:DNA-binding ferritin-like protein (Dps family)
MGYFDDVIQKENEEMELEGLKNKVKTLLEEYQETYKSLTRSTDYYPVLKDTRDKGIQDVIKYFQDRGCEVKHEEVSGADIVSIEHNNFKAQLQVISNDEMHFRIDGKEYEHISVEDKNMYEPKFKGYLHDNQVHFVRYSNDEINKEICLQAIDDLQEDIQYINNRKSAHYVPNLHYYLNERQEYVESLSEYLNLVNEGL